MGIVLVRVEAGQFVMGDAGGYAIERPHSVSLTRPYLIARTEITQAQWNAVMERNPSLHKGDDLPVNNVTWFEAVEFCRRLSAREGRTYRLPTEAEWEYACRAGTTSVFSFGNDGAMLGDYAWYNENARGTPKPVATRRPNPWGLYDMHGNVREWCADWFAWRYPQSAQVDPVGPGKGSERVRRGGSCSYYGSAARSGGRDCCPPEVAIDDHGFRVVVELTPDPPTEKPSP